MIAQQIAAIAVLLALLTPCIAQDEIIEEQFGSKYNDTIVGIYNASCIQTERYEYFYIDNTQINMSNLDWYTDREIRVLDHKAVGGGVCFGNIYFT